jgi:hypothetical protein
MSQVLTKCRHCDLEIYIRESMKSFPFCSPRCLYHYLFGVPVLYNRKVESDVTKTPHGAEV